MKQKKRRTKLGNKLLFYFFVVGFIPLVAIGGISYYYSKNELEKQAFEKLQAVSELLNIQVADYCRRAVNNLNSLVKTASVVDKMRQIGFATDGRNELDDKILTYFDESYGGPFKDFQTFNNYYDIYVLDKDGRVVITGAKESDLGKNANGPELKGHCPGSGVCQGKRGFVYPRIRAVRTLQQSIVRLYLGPGQGRRTTARGDCGAIDQGRLESDRPPAFGYGRIRREFPGRQKTAVS